MNKTRHARGPEIENLETRVLMHGGFDGNDIAGTVTQTNLVSDGAVPAAHIDKNLLNPWGIAFSPSANGKAGSPFWISDNNAGVATLYDGNGVAQPPPPNGPLVVTIPPATGSTMANPTGQVFNTDSGGFVVSKGGKSGSSVFMFVGEDGGISGWNPAVDRNNAVLEVDNGPNAVYKGATLGQVNGNTDLYVTNFRAATVEVYDDHFKPVDLGKTAFVDHRIPAGFAPFNVQNINGNLFVTYAKQNDAKHDDVAGPGNGFVDIYNTSGKLIGRLDHGRFLDSPWGVTVAPADWGRMAGDILVGQFGSGRIDIFDHHGEFRGFLRDASNKPVVIDGLWSLTPGNDGGAGVSDKIYFTAGINKEADGLFGSLTFNPAANNNNNDNDDNRNGNNNDNNGNNNNNQQNDDGDNDLRHMFHRR